MSSGTHVGAYQAAPTPGLAPLSTVSEPGAGNPTTDGSEAAAGPSGVDPADVGATPRSTSAVSGALDAVINLATLGAGQMVRPEAAAAVATGFSFPLLLLLVVVLFLVIQPRFDDRDPKLRRAPQTMSDMLVAFEEDVR